MIKQKLNKNKNEFYLSQTRFCHNEMNLSINSHYAKKNKIIKKKPTNKQKRETEEQTKKLEKEHQILIDKDNRKNQLLTELKYLNHEKVYFCAVFEFFLNFFFAPIF